jgi:predicted transcriptional regulator with HTH domain
MHASHLIDAAGIDQRRLWWAMRGNGATYRIDLALVKCGLVEEIRTKGELRFRLTAAGRREARALLKERRSRGWA